MVEFHYVVSWGNSSPVRESQTALTSEGTPSQGSAINILEEKEKWLSRIKKVGPQAAYSEFKKEFADKRYDEQHSIAHLFGELLYQEKGTEGVSTCDEAFGFGCFHGFFSVILADKGNSVLPTLDKICIDKAGQGGSGCQHGLGHGLIEYYGHNLPGLTKALDDCGKTTIFVKKFGCTSGAFMEFNIPISLDVQSLGLDSKQLDPKNPYFPCTDVNSKFQESCYFELGQWWQQVYHSDYAAIGKLCEDVKDNVNKESCYLGIGYVVLPSSQANIADSETACGKMPNQNGKLLCLAGVTWQLYANPPTRSLTKDVCKTLPGDQYQKCIDKADLIGTHGQTFSNI